MALPCKLILRSGNGSRVTAVPLIEYETDCLDELEASDICQVKEASPLSLTLESDDPTIFFFVT